MSACIALLKELVPVAKDSVLTATALVATYVGLKGLGTWKRQLKGNTEYSLAKSVLTGVYELREAIGGVRNPMMMSSREPDLPSEKLVVLSPKEKEWHAYVQAYQKRWEQLVSARAKLDAVLFEAEAIWGREFVAKIKELLPLIGELRWALETHLENRSPNLPRGEIDQDEVKKSRATLFERGDLEKDEYKKRLDTLVREIEISVKPHIVQHHR